MSSPLNVYFRYTVENSVEFGAPRDTNQPELRQPSALEVWKSIERSLDAQSKITILANGPLTNLAQIINSEDTSSVIQVTTQRILFLGIWLNGLIVTWQISSDLVGFFLVSDSPLGGLCFSTLSRFRIW